MQSPFAAALAAALLLSGCTYAYVEEDDSPYYFADETIEKDPKMTRPRKLHRGPKVYARNEPESDAPEYRKKRSSIEDLKYLTPGKYEGKIVGVLCNACTDAVVANLKRLDQINKASFDYEEGVLRFTVKKPKKKKKKEEAKGWWIFGSDRYRPLRFTKFRRAVRRAGRQVRLDTHFTISEIKKVR